ncbi:MAG: hypothetical protein RL497_2480 [Pseudomonadota bacterium]
MTNTHKPSIASKPPMTKTLKPSSKLLALSAAAMALPALVPQAQAVAPTERTLSYRYTQYNEMGLDAASVSKINADQGGGATQRYDIDINQYAFSTPVGDHFALSIDIQDEVLTGASPWTVVKEDVKATPSDTSDDEVKLVMSGATIKEHRTDASVATTYFYSTGTISANLGFSTEDDYESTSAGLSWGGEFDDKLTGLALGVSFSDDTLNPEEGAYKGTVLQDKVGGWLNGSDPVDGTAKKESVSGFFSASRILTPNWIVQAGVSYTQKSGHLSDAYKANDKRPAERNSYTFNAGSRYWIKPIKAAAHADYRYYSDDWGIDSHTIILALYKNWQKVQIIPSLRYYTQTSASFYSIDATDTTQYNYYADDHRLSNFGAITGGLKLVFKQKPVDWIIAGEYYASGADMSLDKTEDETEHPGLLKYAKFTFGVEHRF